MYNILPIPISFNVLYIPTAAGRFRFSHLISYRLQDRKHSGREMELIGLVGFDNGVDAVDELGFDLLAA